MTVRSVFAASLLFLASSAAALAMDAAEFNDVWKPYLRGMNEPLLSAGKMLDGDFQLRWTRLPHYGEPVSIRIWRSHGETYARAVRLRFYLDYRVGRITRDQTIRLSEKQAAKLRSYLEDTEYWQPRHEGDRILGGTRWLVELRDSSGYHALSLFSPVLLLNDREVGDRAYHWTPAQKRAFRCHIQVATFLLRATKIFPDELTVQE
jgi:hypothetical protein